MPIPFACKCGKRLVAKEEFAGKKMKCPQCAKVLVIPGTPLKTTPAPRTSPPPPRTSNPEVPVARAVRPSTEQMQRPEITPRPTRPAAPTVATPVIVPPITPRPPSGPSIDLSAPLRLAPAPREDKPHPWVDTSLCPMPTPWRDGDRERFQRGIQPMREGTHPLVWALGLLCVIGACVGGALWMQWI